MTRHQTPASIGNMRHNFRNSKGQFAPAAAVVKPRQIRAGSLYGYRGTIVRAHAVASNGKRHVSFHKQLHGFVNDAELNLIAKSDVQQYLKAAN